MTYHHKAQRKVDEHVHTCPLLGIQDLCETRLYAELPRTLHPNTQARCSASDSGSTSIADVSATSSPPQRMKQGSAVRSHFREPRLVVMQPERYETLFKGEGMKPS